MSFIKYILSLFTGKGNQEPSIDGALVELSAARDKVKEAVSFHKGRIDENTKTQEELNQQICDLEQENNERKGEIERGNRVIARVDEFLS